MLFLILSFIIGATHGPATPSAYGQSVTHQPTIKWGINVAGPIGGIAAAGSAFYYGDYDGNLTAVDAQNGSKKWAHRHSGGDPILNLVVDRNVVVFAPKGGNTVVALDADSGRQRWALRLKGKVFSNLSVTDSAVSFYCLDTFIYTVDINTGTIRNKTIVVPQVNTVAEINSSSAFLGVEKSGQYYLCAVDLKTAKELWSVRVSDSFASKMEMFGDTGFFFTVDKTLYSVDLRNGKAIRTIKMMDEGTSLVVDKGVAYVTGWTAVAAYDLQSGRMMWRHSNDDVSYTAPLLVGATIIFGGSDGVLRSLESSNGREIWKLTVATDKLLGDPIVDGNTLCIGTADQGDDVGRLVGVEGIGRK
jgi:outer membrane protein assembly factor BamB